MTQKVSKDIPLAEITLRRYEKPYDMQERELVKKICLSLGLLQPGDSRDVVVDVLLVLLNAKKETILLSSKEVEEKVIAIRKEKDLKLLGIASSNIRRQLKRLKDLLIIEVVDNNYRIIEFEDLDKIFTEKIEGFLLRNIISRVKEYLIAIKKEDEHISEEE